MKSGRVLFVVLLIGIALFLFGCISVEKPQVKIEINGTAENQTVENKTSENNAEQFSARDGLQRAQEKISRIDPDAVLVSIYGIAEQNGKSTRWEYTFDSLKNKKSYTISIPDGSVREKEYLFVNELGNNWMDSTEAARLCPTGEEYLLENSEGEALWTVSSDSNQCIAK